MKNVISKKRLFELYMEKRENMRRSALEAVALVRFSLIRRDRS